MNNIIEKLKNTRLLAGVGVAGLILGTIMPYAQYDFLGFKYSVTLFKYWQGTIILILTLANFLFIFKDFAEKYVPVLFNNKIGSKIKNCSNPKFSLVLTILLAIFVIYLTSILEIDSFGSYRLGFYSMWVGVICLVAYAILHKNIDEFQMKM